MVYENARIEFFVDKAVLSLAIGKAFARLHLLHDFGYENLVIIHMFLRLS